MASHFVWRNDPLTLPSVLDSIVATPAATRTADPGGTVAHRGARPDPVVELRGIGKEFGGVAALRGVDLAVRPGEVHALVGTNGAGKSTLIKILSGALRPDSGRVLVDGADGGPANPRAARAMGIATVHQRRTLVGTLSVAENVVLGALPRRGPLVDWRAVAALARTRLDTVGLTVDLDTPVEQLAPAEQTLVEIARELGAGGRVLILDEPTAALGPQESARIHRVVTGLRDRGTAVVYISHHLDDVLDLADRITVLRDGQRIREAVAGEIDLRSLVEAMVGEHPPVERPARRPATGAPVLTLDGIAVPGRLEPLHLTVAAGEAVAVLGPAGDGQSLLFDLLSGRRRPAQGRITVGTTTLTGGIADSLTAGMRCVPADRLRLGLVPELGVDENIALAGRALARRVLAGRRAVRADGHLARRRFGIRTLAGDPPVDRLSGGNQQKVLLAKWLATGGRCVLLDEPTGGVDVAARAEIHALIDGVLGSGTGVLLCSTDVDEVLRLADRVIVLRSGRVVAEHPTENLRRTDLVGLTVGGGA